MNYGVKCGQPIWVSLVTHFKLRPDCKHHPTLANGSAPTARIPGKALLHSMQATEVLGSIQAM